MPKEFLTIEEIPVGSVWTACDGSGHTVTVISTQTDHDFKDSLVSEQNWVKYNWIENGETKTHEKSLFSFQVRYDMVK